jgi:dipeptidyl aminopeptidase/acylaminoacyl peptidase
VVLQVQVGSALQIHRIALVGGKPSVPVVQGERTCMLLGGDDRQLLFGAGDMHSPADLFLAGRDGGGERRLTRLNDELLSQRARPEVERLEFTAPDGVAVEGWLMLPPAGTPPYPTVLYTHGGPYNNYGHNFIFDFHMLAGAGYAVLFVNYRGSSGYGTEFATQIFPDLGQLEYADLMAGVDAAVARGLADPDRLGCCGGSYGGFLTNWIVGHTRRFKAAVSEASVCNQASLYGASDIPGWQKQALGGTPREAPELYARTSPITYAHNCTTPTLLVVGENDYRCPAEQTEQFYAALKEAGCVTEMLRFPDSSHGGPRIGPLPVRRAQNEALLDWFNRYL